jgi:hypothetical protein
MQQARAAAAVRLQRVQQAAGRQLAAAMLPAWRHTAQRLRQLRSISSQVSAMQQRLRVQQVCATMTGARTFLEHVATCCHASEGFPVSATL